MPCHEEERSRSKRSKRVKKDAETESLSLDIVADKATIGGIHRMEILAFLILPLSPASSSPASTPISACTSSNAASSLLSRFGANCSLGATVAVVVSMDPHGARCLLDSLASLSRCRHLRCRAQQPWHIPQEAFIGIAYAVASATAILLMSKATGETEHLKDMLVATFSRSRKAK